MSANADVLAAEALAWIADSDDLMGIFLGSSGMSVTDVKTQAGSPEFLASVLDFLMMDDQWVIGFCDTHGYAYETPMKARQSLPGGDLPNWT